MEGGKAAGIGFPVSGFVLAGGKSLRMGRDKALLEMGGATLLERTAGIVKQAVGNVMIIGRDGHPDLIADCGPLGGLFTALKTSENDWNLIVACDMPGLTVEFLRDLAKRAESTFDCLIPQDSAGKRHPLCAVYHRRILPVVAANIRDKRLALNHLLDSLQATVWPVPDNGLLANVNTPGDWASRESKVRR